MTNNNTKETKFEVLNCLNVEEITIVVIIWFVIQVFGNGMLLGLIQYDRFGNDPLKRRIIDQVRFQNQISHFLKTPSLTNFLQLFTNFRVLSIACNLISVNMLSWSAITNMDFSYNLSLLVPFSRQFCIGFGVLSTIESISFKYYTEFILKHVPSVDDTFVVYFLTLLNFIFGFILGFNLLFAGSPHESIRLQGFLTELRKKSAYHKGCV